MKQSLITRLLKQHERGNKNPLFLEWVGPAIPLGFHNHSLRTNFNKQTILIEMCTQNIKETVHQVAIYI